MKKIKIVIPLVIVLATVVFFMLAPTSAENQYFAAETDPDVPMLKLPSTLTVIDEEAFAETGIKAVALGDKVSYIGAAAFPRDILIYGEEGSYAQQWSEDNGYRFQSENAWNTDFTPLLSLLLLVQAWLFVPAVDTQHEYRFRRVTAYLRDMRPQERRELYPINYRFP